MKSTPHHIADLSEEIPKVCEIFTSQHEHTYNEEKPVGSYRLHNFRYADYVTKRICNAKCDNILKMEILP